MQPIFFEKYQGAGNDFIIVDNRRQDFPAYTHEHIARACQRRFGIGADGFILIEPPQSTKAAFYMRYFNADGHEGSLCGNGARCAVMFAYRHGLVGTELTFEAYDGLHEAFVKSNEVSLHMQNVMQIESIGEDFFLNTGSPHYVRWVCELASYPVVETGRQIRYSAAFDKLGGTNVNFIESVDAQTIAIRTYERGVEDETYACGTGATAAALVAARQGYASPLRVQALGGVLTIYFEQQPDGTFHHIYLQGPATYVFRGEYYLD